MKRIWTIIIILKEDMVIVDLREPELYANGRVPAAVNIPFDKIKQQYFSLPKDKKIVFVRHVGRMGTESGELLLQNGYREVYNLEGGMAKWSGCRFSNVKEQKNKKQTVPRIIEEQPVFVNLPFGGSDQHTVCRL